LPRLGAVPILKYMSFLLCSSLCLQFVMILARLRSYPVRDSVCSGFSFVVDVDGQNSDAVQGGNMRLDAG
jgi:hypothetical protein